MMWRIGILLLGGLLSSAAVASEGGTVYDFSANLSNQRSLQRGFALFMNYCSGCHSLKYLRYERVSEDLNIPEAIMEENLMFADVQMGAHIETGLPDRSADWFGKAPPDLSLAARHRGAAWVYSFLLTFYLDPDSTSGVNNLQFPNTAMPAVVAPLQGFQKLVDEAHGHEGEGPQFKLVQKGRLSPAEYERAAADLTNFLVYAGEPVKLFRYALGGKVIAFLIFFTVLAWLLKREFWRDVH
ncbi:MAG: cytochrome c1 [Salinisphaera sp.]|nr:cytochrome c1 [Salinisphaera sp.]